MKSIKLLIFIIVLQSVSVVMAAGELNHFLGIFTSWSVYNKPGTYYARSVELVNGDLVLFEGHLDENGQFIKYWQDDLFIHNVGKGVYRRVVSAFGGGCLVQFIDSKIEGNSIVSYGIDYAKIVNCDEAKEVPYEKVYAERMLTWQNKYEFTHSSVLNSWCEYSPSVEPECKYGSPSSYDRLK